MRNRSHIFGAYERDHVDTIRVIALPGSNPFAAEVNGTFPAETDNHLIVGRARSSSQRIAGVVAALCSR